MSDVDVYRLLGKPYPHPETVCRGECEGKGWVPVYCSDDEPPYRQLWQQAERLKKTDDGWHFVRCPVCGGTGRRR